MTGATAVMLLLAAWAGALVGTATGSVRAIVVDTGPGEAGSRGVVGGVVADPASAGAPGHLPVDVVLAGAAVVVTAAVLALVLAARARRVGRTRPSGPPTGRNPTGPGGQPTVDAPTCQVLAGRVPTAPLRAGEVPTDRMSAGRRSPAAPGAGRARAVVAAVVLALTTAGGAHVRAAAVEGGPLAARVHDADGRRVAVDLVGVAAGDPREGQHGTTVVLRLHSARIAGARIAGARTAGARTAGVGTTGAVASPVRSRERILLHLPDDAAVTHGGTYAVRGAAELLEGPAAAAMRRLGVRVAVDAVTVGGLADPPVPHRAATALRGRVREAAHRHLPAAHASLLTGLVTGDLTGQPEEVDADVAAAGLAHLVAVSGSNVALLVAGVTAIALAAGLGRRAAWWLSVAATWWLVLLTRAEPSVVRAAAMATLVLGALLVGRRRSTPALLCTAAVLALLVDPALATRLGFALSVAATAGLLLLAPPLDRRLQRALPRAPASVRRLLAASAGAQLAVAPLLLAVGGSVHPASLPANLVAVPAAALASAIGSAAAVVAIPSPTAGALVAAVARPPLAVVLRTAELFADGPARRVSAAVAVALVVSSALAVARHVWTRRGAGAHEARGERGRAARVPARTGRPRPALLRLAAPTAVAAAVLVVPLARPGGSGAPDRAQLVVLDVGQGDAVLVGDPAGGWLLVDGGPDPEVLQAALARHGVGDLAAVVATHPHADHVDGLTALLGRVEVGALVIGPTGRSAAELLAVASATGTPVLEVARGDGWTHGATAIRVLGPPPTGAGEEPNDNSLVLRLDVGGASALLTGDVEVAGQLLIRDDPAIDVDVVKVPHHGGATNLPGFLRATTPSTAIISAGAGNPFGHPHHEVLADLAGVDVRRTDREGDVVIAPLVAR